MAPTAHESEPPGIPERASGSPLRNDGTATDVHWVSRAQRSCRRSVVGTQPMRDAGQDRGSPPTGNPAPGPSPPDQEITPPPPEPSGPRSEPERRSVGRASLASAHVAPETPAEASQDVPRVNEQPAQRPDRSFRTHGSIDPADEAAAPGLERGGLSTPDYGALKASTRTPAAARSPASATANGWSSPVSPPGLATRKVALEPVRRTV